MDAFDWKNAVGSARAHGVVASAGIDWEYFRHIYKCRKRLSVDAATRLCNAAWEESMQHPKKDRHFMTPEELLRTSDELKKRRDELIKEA